jgi:ribonuclease VapC
MIAVDSSALVAIAFDEPERASFRRTIETAAKAFISPVSVVESKMIVHSRRGERAVILLEGLLKLPMFEIVPPELADIDAAYGAFITFGKGSGHRAGLNFGDVFSYALAKVRDLPLLYKGDDFTHTDIRPAITRAVQ